MQDQQIARLADLLRLSGETLRAFALPGMHKDGQKQHIEELASRIETIADEVGALSYENDTVGRKRL